MVTLNALEVPQSIALVHEWFSPTSVGGAENVVVAIDELLSKKICKPNLFALIEDESHRSESWLFGRSIQTSIIQKFPYGKSHVQSFLPLLPFAVEQLDLTNFQLIISSSHLVAKGVLTSPDQIHVSYVHTPARYAWDQMNIYLRNSKLSRYGLEPLIRWQLHKFRQWDQLSSSRIDHILANSSFTAKRIFKYWRRKSEIVYPPVSVENFQWNKPRDDYYLCVCRLVPNKRVDLLIRAFNQLNLPLIVIGDGVQKNFLKSIAAPNVKILGYQSRKNVCSLMERCRAFVYAGIEDFGIAPVEAMAAGAPVIAYGQGGLLDTVKCANEGNASPTGVLFRSQNISSLIDAVTWFEESKLSKNFNSESIRLWANKFSKQAFQSRFEDVLYKIMSHKK